MNRGLTLLEVILAVSITLVLLLVVLFPFRNMNQNQALSKETANLIGILNNVRSMAMSSKGGVSHGIHFESDRVVLFGGDTYSAIDPNNVSILFNPAVALSPVSLSGGATEVVFNQLKGSVSATGTVTLFLTASTTQTKTVTINATGIIDGTP